MTSSQFNVGLTLVQPLPDLKYLETLSCTVQISKPCLALLKIKFLLVGTKSKIKYYRVTCVIYRIIKIKITYIY